MLMIGKSVETDDEIYLDSNRSRTVLICGKRGSGKSYTLGVLAEELFENEQGIVIIVDPMGIYHTMTLPNTTQEQSLWDWGIFAEDYQPILELFRPNVINVIDLSVIGTGRYGLRNLVLDVLCRNLFRKRTLATGTRW